jgi:hypothetical protein
MSFRTPFASLFDFARLRPAARFAHGSPRIAPARGHSPAAAL